MYVYLIVQVLDDPLSAVDAHVGRALFHNCIMEELRGRGKGVILATHQLQYLKFADKIVVLDEFGEQKFYGNFDSLLARASEFDYLDLNNPTKDDDSQADSKSTTPKTSTSDFSAAMLSNNHRSSYDQSKRSMFKSMNVSLLTDAAKAEAAKKESQRIIIQTEDRVEGRMSFSLFIDYLRSGGIMKGSIAISLAVVSQGLLMITEYWLRWWASESFGPQRSNKYIIIFAVLTSLCVVMGFYRAVSWFEFTLGAANNLHANCLWAVMHSPLQFFIANPTGRILNRFSRDTNQTDEMFPFTVSCLPSKLLRCLVICHISSVQIY